MYSIWRGARFNDTLRSKAKWDGLKANTKQTFIKLQQFLDDERRVADFLKITPKKSETRGGGVGGTLNSKITPKKMQPTITTVLTKAPSRTKSSESSSTAATTTTATAAITIQQPNLSKHNNDRTNSLSILEGEEEEEEESMDQDDDDDDSDIGIEEIKISEISKTKPPTSQITNNDDNSSNEIPINTKELAKSINDYLKINSINESAFSNKLLNLGEYAFQKIIHNPTEWKDCEPLSKQYYKKLYNFINSDQSRSHSLFTLSFKNNQNTSNTNKNNNNGMVRRSLSRTISQTTNTSTKK